MSQAPKLRQAPCPPPPLQVLGAQADSEAVRHAVAELDATASSLLAGGFTEISPEVRDRRASRQAGRQRGPSVDHCVSCVCVCVFVCARARVCVCVCL